MGHTATVQAIYAAFARADIPALLAHLDDNVEWEHDALDHGVPWLKPGKGKAHVGAFFAALGSAVTLGRFQPTGFFESGNQVLVTVSAELTVKASGKTVRDFEVHAWTFGPAGKVTRFRHVVDTHQHVAALR